MRLTKRMQAEVASRGFTMADSFSMKATQDERAAFEWGRSIGRVSRFNNDPRTEDSADDTGLIGNEREQFQRGYRAGYAEAERELAQRKERER